MTDILIVLQRSMYEIVSQETLKRMQKVYSDFRGMFAAAGHFYDLISSDDYN